MPGMIDLTGKTFGKLKVLKRDLSKKTDAAYWICQCECGKQKSVRGDRLRKGEVVDCGCGAKERRLQHIDTTSMVGKRFGRLVVLERDLSRPIGRGNGSYWICQCDCGNKVSVNASSLNTQATKSCGCLRRERTIEKNTLDLTGKRFGKLVAIKNTKELTPHHSYIWLCQCDCGNLHKASAEVLQSGKLHSCGCQVKSYGEEKIASILTDNGILFKQEVTFSDLKSEKNYPLRYDFGVFDQNNNLLYLIEYDGEQHFHPSLKFGGEEGFQIRASHDRIKNNYAKQHNIILFRIPYTELNNLSLSVIQDPKYRI